MCLSNNALAMIRGDRYIVRKVYNAHVNITRFDIKLDVVVVRPHNSHPGTELGGFLRVPGNPMDFFDVMLIFEKNTDFS